VPAECSEGTEGDPATAAHVTLQAATLAIEHYLLVLPGTSGKQGLGQPVFDNGGGLEHRQTGIAWSTNCAAVCAMR
jgi:hypothetical protein